MEQLINKDNFHHYREIDNKLVFSFDLSFDDDQNDFSYETDVVTLIHDGILSKYVIRHRDGFQMSQRASDGEFIEGTSYDVSGYRGIVEEISQEKLHLKIESTITVSEKEYRVVYEAVAKPYTPPAALTKMINQELLNAVERETIK